MTDSIHKSASVQSVTVLPPASLAVAGHCLAHPHASAYGILLGNIASNGQGTVVTVTDALPVSHGSPPSMPIAEAALGLAQVECSNSVQKTNKKEIVGWYTAPMLLDDTRPGPVALRLTASMATTTDIDPILLVVQNKALSDCVLDGSTAEHLVQALGRDFGNQWLEKLTTRVDHAQAVGTAIQQARNQELTIGTDLLDHMENVSKEWYPNKVLSELVKKIEQS